MKKFCVFLIIFIGIVGVLLLNKVEAIDSSYDIKYKYNGKMYNYNIENLVNENNISLQDYPYYLVIKNRNGLPEEIYFSKERIKCNPSTKVSFFCNGETIKMKLNIGETVKAEEIIKSDNLSIQVDSSWYFMASNQNVYADDELIFQKNNGYIYDKTQEKEETCNDIVKAKYETKVYESAAVCYDELTELPIGSAVRRIKREVNEVDGHRWDKVVLSDGTEGYIFSDNVEIVENVKDIKNVDFTCNKKMYNILFSTSTLESNMGININDYPYYLVIKNKEGLPEEIYFSKERIKCNPSTKVAFFCNGETIKMQLDTKGIIKSEITKINKLEIQVDSTWYFMASNQNVYAGDELIFEKNSGYIYDKTQEKTETCNDIVKAKYETKVYESASICYDEIAKISTESVVKRIKKEVNEVDGIR